MLILQGVPPLGGVKQQWGGKTSYFEGKCVNISKTIGDSPKLLLMTNRKLHMRFRVTPRSMTLDDIELYKFAFSDRISWISDATTAK